MILKAEVKDNRGKTREVKYDRDSGIVSIGFYQWFADGLLKSNSDTLYLDFGARVYVTGMKSVRKELREVLNGN